MGTGANIPLKSRAHQGGTSGRLEPEDFLASIAAKEERILAVFKKCRRCLLGGDRE